MRHPRPCEGREPGVHTLSVWRREDGAVLDRILLTSSAGFRIEGRQDVPTRGTLGMGPAESPRK